MKRKTYSNIAKNFASGIAVLGITFGGTSFAATTSNQNDKNSDAASTSSTPYRKNTKPIHVAAADTKTTAPYKTDGKTVQKAYKAPKAMNAGEYLNEYCDKTYNLGKGWKITSLGGLSYEHPDSADYFFRLSGLMRVDQTFFAGDYRDKQPIPDIINRGNLWAVENNAHIRTAEIYLDGGVGKDWEYTATFSFRGNRTRLEETWISYMGFADNNQVFVGNISGNWFGLDNSNSGTWGAFLERSQQTQAFYPGDGLGVMTDFWWSNGAITLTATQPQYTASNLPNNPPANNPNPTLLPEVNDRWKATARATYAPVHEEGNVWHFGLSGAWEEMVTSENGVATPEFRYRAQSETRGRNVAYFLDTGYLLANNSRAFNVEMARQCGPLMLEGEYTEVYLHRTNGPGITNYYGSVWFNGWNTQLRYLLTGESHAYDVRDGQFGSVKPCASYGAFEIVARYDFLNLNQKDVRGGTEHNAGLGINWFVNSSIRLSANYIRASIHPANDAPKRNLDIIGMRCQVRFK